MNKSNELALHVIQEAEKRGVQEFCVCPGARNSALLEVLLAKENLKKYYWFEERSGAFFALGRARETKRPVAIISTSGSATGELLPAAMEAFYNQSPLLLITADRPRRFRGSGAPQAVEHVGIFSHYTSYFVDVTEDEICSLDSWDGKGPAHLNVCFEDPNGVFDGSNGIPEKLTLDQFVANSKFPFVVVGALSPENRQNVADFLLSYKAPVYLEGISGLREDPRLQPLRIKRTEKIWPHANNVGYTIDGVLRIGGVPTFRLWRDLEDKIGQVAVCTVTDTPFSGLSGRKVTCNFSHAYFNLETAVQDDKVMQNFELESLAMGADHSLRVKAAPIESDYSSKGCVNLSSSTAVSRFNEKSELRPNKEPSTESWLVSDAIYAKNLHRLFKEEPLSESGLIHKLSKIIPNRSQVYLGNSLPIREWDLAADYQDRKYHMTASRGVNGIDGQISTFLGMCRSEIDNWAVLGDLTALYDMAGPWILRQMHEFNVTIVVVNNGGGQIFSRMFPQKEFLHSHDLNFKPLADMWGMHYERWTEIPESVSPHRARLIEIVPDAESSQRFWQKLDVI
jgi:2-succinyl-5-enolpyruvyl-6-hydroxy-3-cyclohexene-1-carboxylate synthase